MVRRKFKKILVVVNNVWPPPVLITGISVIYACQKELANLGNEVHILTSIGLWDKNAQRSTIDELYDIKRWFSQEEKESKIKFHSYNLRFLAPLPRLTFIINRFLPLFWVPYLHFKFKFDVIHEYTSTPLLIYRSWFLKQILRRVKIFHTLISEIPSFLGSPKWLNFFNPRIDRVICSSQRITNNLISCGYPRDLVYSLSLGVDNQKFLNLPSKEVVRKRHSIKERTIVFLLLAPLEPHKGPKLFVKGAIQALKLARKKDILFILATYDSPGKKPYKERKAEIIRLISEKKEYFRIYEGILRVKELMSLSDVVVVPQTTLDGATGHPVTLLEALAAKKIVIASNIYGPNEIIKDGFNGFLFKNKNLKSLTEKILYVIKKQESLRYVKENAFDTVKKDYRLKQIAKAIDALYDRKR